MEQKARGKWNVDFVKAWLKYRVLHIDDSAHRIALGSSIGLFVAWTPLIGFHVVGALLFAWILRANKFVAVTFSCASNVLTIIPVYYPNYLVGKKILDAFRAHNGGSEEVATSTLQRFLAVGNVFTEFHRLEFWRKVWQLFMSIGAELFVGGFVIGGGLAICSYIVLFYVVKWHRKKHPRKRLTN